MGALRTINHPGIQINEYDLSDYASTVGGTTSLVIGFSPQGRSGVPVVPTSTAAVKSYFGIPKTEEERYFFYACKEVFDKGGNLIAARIPYNNNAQYLCPAVKYDIETWQTTHERKYAPSYRVSEVKSGTDEFATKWGDDPAPTADEILEADYFEMTYKPYTTTLTVLNGADATERTEVVALVSYVKDMSKVVGTGNLVDKVSVDSRNLTKDKDGKEFVLTYTAETGAWTDGKGESADLADYGISIQNGVTPEDGVTITVTYAKPERVNNVPHTPAKFIGLSAEDGKTPVSEILNGTSHTKLSVTFYTDDEVYYVDHKIADKATYAYNKVKQNGVNYPVVDVVQKYADGKTVDCAAVKTRYVDGEGPDYLSCVPTDFTEISLTDKGRLLFENAGVAKSDPAGYTAADIVANISLLDGDNLKCFEVVRHEYVGEVRSERAYLPTSFKCAPVSSDVTVDADESEALSIPAMNDGETWGSTKYKYYPEIMAADPFQDGNYRYVASKIPLLDGYEYSPEDFYELQSAFTSVSGIAKAGSQNYKWIHWKRTSTSFSTSGEGNAPYIGNSVLMSALAGMEVKDVPNGISDIENLVAIRPNTDHFGFVPLSTFQDYRDGAQKPPANSIVVCNITERQFDADDYNNSGMECLGIMPVLVGGLQAVPKQQIVTLPENTGNGRVFNAVESAVRGSLYDIGIPESEGVDLKYQELSTSGFYKDIANTEEFNPYEGTISNDVLGNVPTVNLNADLRPDGVQKNCVTLVVCELAVSKSFDNKVYVNVLESFTGSLDRNAVDGQKKSIFIDNVVNSEDTGSSYVRLYSNFEYADSFRSYTKRDQETEEYISRQTNDNTATITVPASLSTDLWFTKPKESMSLGFSKEQTRKYIAYSTIAATLESIYDTLSNVDETVIDVVVDAGLSTVANRIKRICDLDPEKVKAEYAPFWERITSLDHIAGWKSICAKYITFCSSVRKDCMAVVDAPRNLSVYNDVKLVSNTKYSIDFDVMPALSYLGGLNSSYCAGYANWASFVDDFSGKTVWLPPSIIANGSIIYTDYNAQYFDAPAGTRRGLVPAAIDVSFNPNARQQDMLYGKSWNYLVNTTADGIVLWGQKTTQTRASAFDRINVRRLFLRLERLTRNAVKPFIFEGNTERLRNRVVDMLTPIYENCKTNGGLYDYQLICDTRNNTPTSIDNKELRLALLLRPTKTSEFLVLSFFALSTGMDFAEAYAYL